MNRLQKGQSAGQYKHIAGFKQEDVKQNLTSEVQEAALQRELQNTAAPGAAYRPSFLPGAADVEDKAAKAMAAAKAIAARMSSAAGPSATATAPAPAPSAAIPAQPRKRRTFSDAPADAGTEASESASRKRRTFSEAKPEGDAATSCAAPAPLDAEAERAARKAKRKSKWDQVGDTSNVASTPSAIMAVTSAQLSSCSNPQELKQFVEQLNKSNAEYDALQNERKTNATAQYATGNMMESEDGTGKHHFNDFIPQDALAKFHKLAKGEKEAPQAAQIDMSNKGAQMMAKMGFTAGQGLGLAGTGMTSAIDAGVGNALKLGVGVAKETWEPAAGDDDFTLYRKKMMLGYKHRPNPLNNPRTAYH